MKTLGADIEWVATLLEQSCEVWTPLQARLTEAFHALRFENARLKKQISSQANPHDEHKT